MARMSPYQLSNREELCEEVLSDSNSANVSFPTTSSSSVLIPCQSSANCNGNVSINGVRANGQPATNGICKFPIKTSLSNGQRPISSVVINEIQQKSMNIKEWLSKLDDDCKLEFFRVLFVGLGDTSNFLNDLSRVVENQLRRVLRFGEPFALLPRHLSLKILGFLEPRTLCACMLVCRFWRDLCRDSSLWRSLCHHPDNYRLCSLQMENEHLKSNTSHDGTILWKKAFSERYRLWQNWHAGRCVIRTYTGHDQGVSCVQFDSQRIVSGSSDSTIRIWDLKSDNDCGIGKMTLTGHSGTVRCLHLDKNRLASGSNDYCIKVWDLAMNPTWSHIACRRTLLGHRNVVRCLQMSGDKVVSGSYDQTLKVWSIETGQCICTLEGSSDSVLCLQYNTAEGRIVSGSADASIRVWDERVGSTNANGASAAGQLAQRPSSSCVMTLHNAHDAAVTCVRMDAERIVSGSIDRTIRIWDVRTGRCLQTIDWKLAGHTGVVRCLQTDSWRMVSAADDKTIKVWKLSNGSRLCTLQGHTDGVTCVQFDDNRIVSGSYDKTVKLWDFTKP